MASNLDIPLHGPAVSIVSRCGPALSDVLQSKFGCVATIHGVDFEGGPHIAQGPSVVPEKRCAFKLRAGVQVSVWRADLTSFPQAEAVANAANENLQHYGGLALALSTAGGSKIQQESDIVIKKKGPLSTGDAIITDAGRLPCKKIIHAVGPHLSSCPSQSDVHQAEPLLKKAIRSILDKVMENCLKTVAIPAISSGLFNFPLPLCADTIVRTVKDYYEYHQRHRPQEIFLVNNDEPTVREMERACHEHLSPVMSTKQSKAAASKSSSYAKTPTATVQLGNVCLTLMLGKIEEQQAFEERIRLLQQKRPHPNFLPGNTLIHSGNAYVTNPVAEMIRNDTDCDPKSSFPPAIEHRDNFHSSRAPIPLISLSGPAEDATYEAERWLDDLLYTTPYTVVIRNNFILHFGEEEHRQLSRLNGKDVSIKERYENGYAEITVSGKVVERVVAGLQVEAMLCNIQREFVREEESTAATLLMKNSVSSERKTVESLSPEFSNRSIAFRKEGLEMLKMDEVKNSTLEMLFQLKKNQIGSSIPQKMFQFIPLQFSEMVSYIGFHAEFAPPEDAAYGEGIYFADSVKKAMEVWKPKTRYLHFVEAEVLTGNSTPGKKGLILPPAVAGTDPRLYDSVRGPGVSVIFSGYQALPKYIITCKALRVISS
ncbi:hypothetical protein L3Q82_017714 [Scortum barcoo]|uniref:Uncharacterized protein n=1 Tax=Scortum barcoo TaxID=214431 RepID=A0ACB8VLM8_9TELE|nr:hypothetical protein L3Q82_017714 [Scortum barcoo]